MVERLEDDFDVAEVVEDGFDEVMFFKMGL